ncbi:nucleotide sugar dehydrogenase [Candidatus Thioglobus autotrophicus]|uniref:nucleotide sugar dehydrogenase n=1 Tax=Candidatus Thioglobus autotrophicus TaxID=1705394 RepID=UPI00299F1B18|nr:nucleotide sugar dehydrogenase [Candidatus Thioglobus autotrophicus]WPE15956.1 nucleotide sugar dehydrogenase [Candidatus Thioglobus autotrophicus]
MKNEKICLIGLGYVGLPLAVAFAEKFEVVGFDINNIRIQELKGGYDKTLEINDKLLESVKSNITYTSNMHEVEHCNIYIITVPTPVDKYNRPDLKALIESSKSVGAVLSKDDLVIYESTVYPGVTEDICIPELEKSSNLIFNKDFFCGYSPERINPGDKEHTVTKILKVTSGSTPEIARKVNELYKAVITAGTFLASSIKVAEASKVIENTQRDVNIALINELALIFDKMDIDTNEVLEAAATKWNFINLTPGLVGGHCIGVDPYYLTFKAEEVGYKPDLILAARQINNGMAKYIADKTIQKMVEAGKTIKNSNILILGLTFKEDCPDMRNTKVINIIKELIDFGVNVDVYDPWIDCKEDSCRYTYEIIDNPLDSDKTYDAIVVAVGHKQFKSYTTEQYQVLSNENNSIVIDVKNIVDRPSWRL